MMASVQDQYYHEKIFGKKDLTDFDSKNHFKELCLKKTETENLTSSEILDQERFFEIVNSTNNKYPLVYIPTFIQDFMSGWYDRTLLERYHFRNFHEIGYIVKNILKIKEKRTRVFRPETLIKNLKNIHLKKIYDFLIKNSSVFKDELSEILNQNILRTIIILNLYEKIDGVDKNEILNNFSEILTKYQSRIKIFKDEKILRAFLQYTKNDLEKKINDTFQKLQWKGYVKYQSYNSQLAYIDPKYTELKRIILNIIEQHPDGLLQDTLQRKLLKEIPLLKLAPKVGLWESILVELENSEITRKPAYWRWSPESDQLFTQNDFKRKIEKMRQDVAAAGTRKFFGRRVTPDTFVDELEILEKGNIDDIDDQVTRIAGLVLAGSILLQSPHEKLEVFDFAVDTSNFDPNPEQMKAMQRVDFTITGKIIHSKVMIGESVELSLIDKIKEKLPPGEQAVIFTFEEIPIQVRNSLPSDKSIQIVNKEGILSWTSITPVIPCRVGSIAKVMYGDLRGKIVRINSINYESGFADVVQISSNEDTTVYIGSLEEVWFGDYESYDYLSPLKNYHEFLLFLSDNIVNPESFDKALFEPNIQSARYSKYESYTHRVITSDVIDVKSNEKYSPFESSSPNSTRRIEWEFKVSDVETKIIYQKRGDSISFNNLLSESSFAADKIRSFLKCECLFFKEQSNPIKLCSHIVAALDFIAKKLNQFNNSSSDTNDNLIQEFMLTFQKLNKDAVFDYVSGWFSDNTFYNLIKFIKNLPRNNDLQPEEQPLLPQKMLDDIRIELLSESDSTDFSRALSEMESMIVSMNRDEISKITDVLECRYLDELSKRKDFDRM